MARVGTRIKTILSWFFIRSHGGCHCDDVCEEMDKYPIANIERRMEHWVEEVYASAQEWRKGMRKMVPPPTKWEVQKLIETAIYLEKKADG